MDFSLTAEQMALRDSACEFARQALNADLIARDRDGVFARAAWDQCAKFGVQGLPFPQECGGAAAGALTTVLVMEALGRGCRDNGLLFSLNAQMWSVALPISRFGTPDQQHCYLRRLCNGELIGAHAMSEPGSGSDAFSLQTSAERRGDRYVLNGRKTFVTDAPVADLFLIFATLDKARGQFGVTAFLVERGTPGLQVGRPLEKMGLRTSPMAELSLDQCMIPTTSRLGREGNGASIFGKSMAWERGCLLSSCVGAMERQLDECLTYAGQRRQFGQPIGSFQAVGHVLANMKVRLDAARYLLYRVACLLDQGERASAEAAVAKLFISEAWVQSSLDAVQLHGGYGYMTEMQVERDLRDATAARIFSGTSDIQRNIIANSLGME
jgi:alkylation response protein AidB-like acyl-CoA dehydrogenase